MSKITKKAESDLLAIVQKMEKGDSIRFDGVTFWVYNSQGCEIDCVNSYEN